MKCMLHPKIQSINLNSKWYIAVKYVTIIFYNVETACKLYGTKQKLVHCFRVACKTVGLAIPETSMWSSATRGCFDCSHSVKRSIAQ